MLGEDRYFSVLGLRMGSAQMKINHMRTVFLEWCCRWLGKGVGNTSDIDGGGMSVTD